MHICIYIYNYSAGNLNNELHVHRLVWVNMEYLSFLCYKNEHHTQSI